MLLPVLGALLVSALAAAFAAFLTALVRRVLTSRQIQKHNGLLSTAFVGLHIDAVTMLTILLVTNFALSDLCKILIRSCICQENFIRQWYFNWRKVGIFAHNIFWITISGEKGCPISEGNFSKSTSISPWKSSENSVWSVSFIQVEERTGGFRLLRNF